MENKQKQTAVEWAIAQMDKLVEPSNQIAVYAIFMQAKAMEKEQIKKASFICGAKWVIEQIKQQDNGR